MRAGGPVHGMKLWQRARTAWGQKRFHYDNGSWKLSTIPSEPYFLCTLLYFFFFLQGKVRLFCCCCCCCFTTFMGMFWKGHFVYRTANLDWVIYNSSECISRHTVEEVETYDVIIRSLSNTHTLLQKNEEYALPGCHFHTSQLEFLFGISCLVPEKFGIIDESFPTLTCEGLFPSVSSLVYDEPCT